jgi:hypothetical protein
MGRAVGQGALGRREQAAFTALDAVAAAAFALGPLVDNRARSNQRRPQPQHVALVDTFPDGDGGAATHVEAVRRNQVPRPWLVRDVVARYAEDDGSLTYALDFLWLTLRHPLRVASMTLAGVDSLASAWRLAPTARRLERSLANGATWAPDPARSTDADLLCRLVRRPASERYTSAVERF